MAGRRRGWGRLRKLGSGRWQAGYVGPDLLTHYAPTTFKAKIDAEGWLAQERRLVESGDWVDPDGRKAKEAPLTLETYALPWLNGRDLKPRTRAHYAGLLERLILPELGDLPLANVTPSVVRRWHGQLLPDKPTMRAHAYSLLRTVMNSAVRDGLVAQNPCNVPGAGQSKRAHTIEPATARQLDAIVEAMPERYRVGVLLSAWCALRFGELAELRRKDLDMKKGVVKVRRGVVQLKGERVVGSPKSTAGVRDVAMPPHIVQSVQDHLDRFVDAGPDALVLPGENGGHLSPSVLHRRFNAAAEQAGRPDLRWHDLRHTGAVLAAQAGATLPELMGRLGHSTVGAALRYQHAAEGRDMKLAEAMSRALED